MLAVPLSRLPEISQRLTEVSRFVRAGVARRVTSRLDRSTSRVRADLPLLEAVLTRLDPTLSLHAVRARVVRVVEETPDTRTFWLRPNARFGSFRPGSYVDVRVVIDGQRVQRSYSISSAPRSDGLISITVKRVADGRVSNWLADTVQPGSVLELSPAAGNFVLPAELPPKILLLSAGSGITPVMSMLRELVARQTACRIAFVHFARTPRDVIFREELERIAGSFPNVRIELFVESADEAIDGATWTGGVGRVSEQQLAAAVPDFASLDTFMCGPAGFMRAVLQIWERCGADLSKVRYERFNSDFDASAFLTGVQLLRFVRSSTENLSTQPRTVLQQAESAGLRVASGCRAGNCGTCRCRKLRGVVVDITTGLPSGDGEEFIYPCVSVAQGTVEVDL